MSLDLNYPNMLSLFQEHRAQGRFDSAAFLIWYLEHYYRLDPDDAVDSVCDHSGDKGIDGIVVDDVLQVIFVFQAKIRENNRPLGDVDLKEFAGTLAQISDADSVNNLIANAGKAQVAGLLTRLGIPDKIGDYEVRGVFLSNVDLDTNGSRYLQFTPNISFEGRTHLQSTYISDQRDEPISNPVSFDVSEFQITEYTVDESHKAFITPISAADLVKLDGIADQTIFNHNVRGPLGATNVNKDIRTSIQDPELHSKFPLFHNGITVIADNIESENGQLTVSGYSVVNGCQSLVALYTNKDSITEDLFLLTKFIQVDSSSVLAQQITEYSNNQNGTRARDFKANSAPQIRLQNEFKANYPDLFHYSIKRGEAAAPGVVISNEDAGLYLMAFDLKEPWATHRKYEIFDDKHSALFARPAVNADRIVMLHVIREEIDEIAKNSIHNPLFGKYVLTRYLMMFIMRSILEDDLVGRTAIQSPQEFVRDQQSRETFRECVRKILGDVVIDLNGEINELDEDFDYRGRLREEGWVKDLARRLVADYLKQVHRDRIPSFQKDWESKNQ